MSLISLPPISRSLEDVRYEEDLLEWLKSYRYNDTDFFPHNPELDVALTSHFPKGRYNEGLEAFLWAFRGLLPRTTQRPDVIIFKVRPFSGLRNSLSNTDCYAAPDACTHTHQNPSTLRPSLRRSSTSATIVQSRLLSDGAACGTH